jgi:hypothetical protein
MKLKNEQLREKELFARLMLDARTTPASAHEVKADFLKIS